MNKISCPTCNLSFEVAPKKPLLVLSRCPRCGSKEILQPHAHNIATLHPNQSRYPNSLRRGSGPNNVDLSGPKFLYLANEKHVGTWILGGGPVPIKPASTYLADTREGTQTPDENLIHDSNVDLLSLAPAFKFEGNNIGHTFINCTINGARIPDMVNVSLYRQDGLVLCFSNTKSSYICGKLGKKFCVMIEDIKLLKSIIDEQIGVPSIAGHCEYTADHQRNHFLKSVEDEWMDEFRLFWPVSEERFFQLPPGVAKVVSLEAV